MECRPKVVPDAVLDESVDSFLIRKYFTNDAWLLVMDTYAGTKERGPCLDLLVMSARLTFRGITYL